MTEDMKNVNNFNLYRKACKNVLLDSVPEFIKRSVAK